MERNLAFIKFYKLLVLYYFFEIESESEREINVISH